MVDVKALVRACAIPVALVIGSAGAVSGQATRQMVQLAKDTYVFTGAGSNPTYKMDMSGYFFGPTANEIGAVFRLSGGGGNGNGAMVGKQ